MTKRVLLLLAFLGLSATVSAAVLPINKFGGLNTDEPELGMVGASPDSENVVTDSGFGLQGRKGFIAFSTETSNGNIWEFPMASGVRYIITISSASGSYKLVAAETDGLFETVIATVASDRTIAAAALGDRFYFANVVDGIRYWSGPTSGVTVASASLTVDKLVTHKGRLWAAGKSGSERTLYASRYLDGTDWTLETTPTDDGPTQLTVAGAIDEAIQALYSSFQDKLVWFKRNSFGGIYGSRRSNFTQRTFSDSIGVVSPESIQDCDDRLRWMGPDRTVWEFDGVKITKISDVVDEEFRDILQGDTNSRSETLATSSELGGGTDNPAGWTTRSDIVGTITLATRTATADFADTSQADFEAGTLTNLDSTFTSGSLQLAMNTAIMRSSAPLPSDKVASGGPAGQQFDGGFILTRVGMYLFKSPGTGSPNPFIAIVSDNSGTLGTTLKTIDVDASVIAPAPGAWYEYNVSPPLTLESGIHYWIVLEAPAGYRTMAAYPYYGDTGTGNGHLSTWNSDFNGYHYYSDRSCPYIVYGSTYVSSGNIVSQTFNVGFSTAEWYSGWLSFTASSSCPTGTSITFETQTSSNSSTWNTLTSVNNGDAPTSLVTRYFRYKATLTGGTTYTPVLNSVTVDTSEKRRPYATYITPAINVGSHISAWGPVTISDNADGGTITYEVASSTSWVRTAFQGWTSITKTGIPTVATNTYIAIRSSFTITSATQCPRVDAITVSWLEGSTIKTASGYYDGRYWIAVATTGTTNHIVYVFDRNNQWQRYTGINATTMGNYNSRLYFGNGSGIFLTASGYSDNGNPIISYYRTGAMAPTSLDLFSLWDSLFMTTEYSDASLTSTYRADGVSTDYSLGAYTMNTGPGIQNVKLPFSVREIQSGKYIGFKWRISGTTFWRILNGNLYYQPSVIP